MSDARRSLDWSLAGFDSSCVADELLASLDIAEVNLACAKELPSAEELARADACLAKIDEWSDKVRQATSRNYFRFLEEPQVFDHIRSASSTFPPAFARRYSASAECATIQSGRAIQATPEILAIASSTELRTVLVALALAFRYFTSPSADAWVIRYGSSKAQDIFSYVGTKAIRVLRSLGTASTLRPQPTALSHTRSLLRDLAVPAS